MNQFSLILILLSSFAGSSLAQETYYRKGTNTVLNAIVLQEDGYFPFHRMVVLKNNNQEEHFTAAEVSEYKTIRGKIYYSHLHDGEYIFLRKVLEGKMSLYEHIGKENERLYFIHTDSSGIVFLSPKARRKSGYKKTLDSAWTGCERNKKYIENTAYTLNALIRIIRGNNKCKPLYTGSNKLTVKGGIAQVRTSIKNPGDPSVPISGAVYVSLEPKDVNSIFLSFGYEKAIKKSDLSWMVNADFYQYSSITTGTFSVQQFQDRVYGFDFNYSMLSVGPGLKFHVPISENLNFGFSAFSHFVLYLKSDISVLERKFEDGIVFEENDYELSPSGSNFAIGSLIDVEYAINEKIGINAFTNFKLQFRGDRILAHNILAFGVGLGIKI